MKKRSSLAACFLTALLLMAGTGHAGEANTLKPEGPMTNARLEAILKTVEPNVKGSNGRWEMVRDGVPVMVLTDESHNRMRVIAPASELKQVDQQILMRMMEANFARALDARYAVFQGIVWAAFIHPLDSLRERDLISGLQQVISLVKTTGTTFSSSELQFGPSYQEKGK
ncbi:MAG: hypothetical protein HY694_13105 [Deltaproteobacteria bacterium]|nr:hypothetical protein [Deltaproteobacteria bacterium]